MMPNPRKFAVFDIDGTLIRWQLFHAIVHHLGQEGYILRRQHEQIRAARMRWKNREDVEGFRAYELLLLEIYLEVMKQILPEDHDRIVDEVVGEYRDQTHVYTRDLARRLQKEGYLLFAISGSHEAAVGKVARHHGFDDYLGASFEVRDGQYTGEVTTPVFDKAAALRTLAEKHHATFEGSYAVGDSFSDISMLNIVEHPVAFNPDRGLYQTALSHHWPIVVERKNVVYELLPKDDDYVLSSPTESKGMSGT
jgi:HAD superfamily hydrolase (TIGR01490 family)